MDEKIAEWPFQENRLYNRRQDIHEKYKGQRQGGISTPADVPGIFIFTGHGAKKHGYADRFLGDGSFRFTGEGQVGDMRMIKGNKAIRDHAANGKDILVFRKSGSRKPIEFVGIFAFANWEIERQPDTNGEERDAIVFTLVRLESISKAAIEQPSEFVGYATLADLRKTAYSSQSYSSNVKGQSSRTIYERSRDVREYVLARAEGACEACSADAPFTTNSGRPYLEPHHIRRVSDGGLDHPAHVAAICPNCHRRAHYGSDAASLNQILTEKIAAVEAALEPK